MKMVFTTGKVAKICKVASRTVSKWFDTGLLKGYRIPGSQDRRIPYESLLRFLREYGMPTAELEALAAFRVLSIGLDVNLQEVIPAVTEPDLHVAHANNQFVAGNMIGIESYWPDVIILDTLLGNGEVRGLLQSFKAMEKLKKTAVIVIAGTDGTVEEFDGASTVLRRPFNPVELKEKLDAFAPSVSA